MRRRVLHWFADQAIQRRSVVWISTAALTLALGAACTLLTLDVRWTNLLPDDLPVVKEFHKIDRNFLQPANLIVAIRGPDPVVLEKITDEVEETLRHELLCEPSWSAERCKAEGRYARHIYGKLPEEWITDHLLRIIKPRDAERMADLLRDPRLLPYLKHLNDDLEAEYTDAENVANQEREIVASLDAIEGFARVIHAAADGHVSQEPVARAVRDLTIGRPYLFSLDNRMSLIMVASAIPSDDVEAMPLIDRRVEEILRPLAERYPDYRIERTGEIAVGRDEMESIGPQSQMITLLALVFIFLLLIWNFRSARIPVFAVLPIVIGVIWAVGVIALTLGSMNIFTVMIGVILLGLGIDFSLHLANRFQEELAAGETIEVSLRKALGETGTGVLTGALTTSVAFFSLMVADTRGIREFGFCAGMGVLVTLAAVFWLLPALLASWSLRQQSRNRLVRRSRDFAVIGRVASGMASAHWVVVIVACAATAACIWAGMDLDWEWNFMELEPEGLRSVELQDEIIDHYKISMTFSVLTAGSVEESRTLRKKLKAKGIVGDVDDVSLWVSRPDVGENLRHLPKLRADLAEKRPALEFSRPGDLRSRFADELDRLWANIVEIQALSFIGGQDRVVEKTRRLIATRGRREAGLLRQIADRFLEDQDIAWAAVDTLAARFGDALQSRTAAMVSGEEPVTLSMVPEDIRAKYTSPTVPGFLIHIFPKRNLFEREDLERFQGVVEKVHPHVTGFPQMMLAMNLETIREGKIAFWTALAVILLVLLADFRRPLHAGLAVLPLFAGLAFTLGLMWLTGEKLHYVNVIALPVIIGIGVDDGVHFLHRYLQEGRGELRQAATGVGRAMLMTSLTTMIGFGSLMLYLMRGMASLGFVLFVGVAMCLLVSLTVLPALTRLLERWFFRESA